jgi:hypothetical protein
MAEPPDRLRFDLRTRARYNDLSRDLGEPHNEPETELLIMLARFLNDDELATLRRIAQRPGAEYRSLLWALAVYVRAGRNGTSADGEPVVLVELPEAFSREILLVSQ